MDKKNIVSSGSLQNDPIVKFPTVASISGNMLNQLTSVLGVDRSVIASDQQIEHAWSQLPRLIQRIPSHLRDEKIVKACIAVASGLFEAAINYIWNAAIVELRQKVHEFGLNIIPEILDNKSFDEESLEEIKDAELLDLCLRLNLISEKDYFFLDQCRATRNSYSAAHPSGDTIDEDEIISFLSRCQKHALSSKKNPKGVDTKKLLRSLSKARFTEVQLEEWVKRLRATFDAQRELIFGMLHGVYCDPTSGEETRVNAISICLSFKDEFSLKTQSLLVDRHQDYKAKGDEKRLKASRLFFERVTLISILGNAEVHSMITAASQNLLRVHNDMNNFYNEPPFAERLQQLTKEVSVPESAQATFVEAVITCGVGNTYGVSRAAMPSYHAMVKSFSPKEIKIMLELPGNACLVGDRVKHFPTCAERFKNLVGLLDESSVPQAVSVSYNKWKPKS